MGVNRRRFCVSACACLLAATPAPAAELRFCIRTDPKTFDPLLAAEEASETVRYLTGGVLMRLNRKTQQIEPELASSWKISGQAKQIDLQLRSGVKFSDGSPFGPNDVVAAFDRIMSIGGGSGIADAFRSGGRKIQARATGANSVSVSFSTPVAGVELLFDQLAIPPASGREPGRTVLGPFLIAEYKAGQYVLLHRNPYYWKRDPDGKQLPYLDSVRLDIQSNRDTELLRFRRGELHFVDKLDPENFDRLRRDAPSSVHDLGPSLDSEFFWFNQAPDAAIPRYMAAWFHSASFRRAVSAAVNRNDIIRLVYRGHASAAAGPVSAANAIWFNSGIAPQAYDPKAALQKLLDSGFKYDGGVLRDRGGNAVEFSMITNAGSKTRQQIGTMLQQDLKKIGIRLNFTPIEFQSLVERITHTQQYEACLLGLTNVDVDPNSQANVWISSGTHHAWSPAESKPATPWEAEIDKLMAEQAIALSPAVRKAAFDRVQEIVSQQAPIIYLVNPNVLVAIANQVRGAEPSALPPHLFWNIDRIWLAP